MVGGGRWEPDLTGGGDFSLFQSVDEHN